MRWMRESEFVLDRWKRSRGMRKRLVRGKGNGRYVQKKEKRNMNMNMGMKGI